MKDDRIWKQILYCSRHTHIPDLHSFMVNIKNGVAFVEVRPYGDVFIETKTQNDAGEERSYQWAGTLAAAANRLEMLSADPDSISM